MPRVVRKFRSLSRWPVWARYAGSLTLVLLAFAVVSGAPSALQAPSAPYLIFIPAILLSAVLFDHRSSVFATLLSSGLSIVFLAAPARTIAEVRSGDVIAIALLLTCGAAIAMIVEQLRHTVDDLSNANAQLVHASMENARRVRLFDAVLEGTQIGRAHV